MIIFCYNSHTHNAGIGPNASKDTNSLASGSKCQVCYMYPLYTHVCAHVACVCVCVCVCVGDCHALNSTRSVCCDFCEACENGRC